MNPSLLPVLLGLGLVLPVLGSIVLRFGRLPPARAARICLSCLGLQLATACLAAGLAVSRPFPSGGTFVVDALSAPMLPVLAALHLLVSLGIAKSRIDAALCARILMSSSLAAAIVTCRNAPLLIFLFACAAFVPLAELRASGRPIRSFVLHMTLFVGLLGIGSWLVARGHHRSGSALTLVALLIRGGILPLHGWIPTLFQSASFGTAALYVLPLLEIPAALLLLLPHVPPEWLATAGYLCLATALYAGGMAVVQDSMVRFFAYLCLSQTSLALFGVMLATPEGLTAALCLWVSTSLALAALAFTLHTLLARFGPMSLHRFHGHYEQVPGLAVAFLVSGLASVGFPGTIGFIPMELLFSGSADHGLHVSSALAIAAMFNGIALLRAYFSLFTGRRPSVPVSLTITRPERWGTLFIALLVFVGGWLTPKVVESRHRTAETLLSRTK